MDIEKLSIIIPCYNERNTIEEIVDKVLAVDLEKIEKEVMVLYIIMILGYLRC